MAQLEQAESGVLSPDFQQIMNRQRGNLAGVKGNLLSAMEGNSIKSVLFSSCSRGEGKTLSAVGIGYALATMAGMKVLLVDGNYQNPELDTLFNLEKEPGLADLILDGGAEYSAPPVQKSEFSNLDILTCGSAPPNSLEVLASGKFSHWIKYFEDKYDLVVVDSSPFFANSDALEIAKYVQSVVMVIECERITKGAAQAAINKLEKGGGRVLGVVLNKRRFYIPRFLYSRM